MGRLMSEKQEDDKAQSFTPLIKDTLVGHYKIIDKIGAGGMGEVGSRLGRRIRARADRHISRVPPPNAF